MNKLPYAHDMNYWQTSKSPAGAWIDKSIDLIEKHGGHVLMSAKGNHMESTAYCIEFTFNDEKFKAVWPVLESKYTNEEKACERQAATMLYHDIKARCMKLAIFGARYTFFDMILLEDGRIAGQLSNDEIINHSAQFLLTHVDSEKRSLNVPD